MLKIWLLARFEVRFDVRLLRTWLFVAFAVFVGVTNALEQHGVYAALSAISSGTFMHSPLLMPLTVFPDFQVVMTFGLVFIAIDIDARDRLARIDEVIASMPYSNAQLVFGRALGLALLLSLVFTTFLVSYFLVGYVCEVALPDVGFQRPEIVSTAATLITDALPYMYFWTATVMFITVVCRGRAVAAAISIVLMLLSYWLQNNAPMYLINVLGTYTLSSLLPSELAPTFTTLVLVSQRIALVCLGTALLFWTAYLLRRLDTVRTRRPLFVAVMLTLLSVLGFGVVHAQTINPIHERDVWRQAHSSVDAIPQIDVASLSGTIDVTSRPDLVAEFQLGFKTQRNLAANDTILFSLNPGYEIEEISLAGEAAEYSFQSGLLAIRAPYALENGTRLELSVRVRGMLNPRFAQLDTVLDRLTSDAVTGYGLLLLGSKSAIVHDDYVALPPAIAWFPMAGPHVGRENLSERPRDFFNVQLQVRTPSDWHVALPEKTKIESKGEVRVHTATPAIPIHELGMYAANFERRVRRIEGIEFELLVNPNHTTNLDLLAPIVDAIESEIAERIRFSRQRGFEYPFETFTIAETPMNLRTYGGGWQMPSLQSLPGVFLMREGTFLAADFQSVIHQLQSNTDLSDDEQQDRLLSHVLGYFRNEILGGNVVHSFADNFLKFRTTPTGEGAERLNALLDYLVIKTIALPANFYSVQNLKAIATLVTARLGAWDIAGERTEWSLNQLYFEQYINRPEVWEYLLENPGFDASEPLNPRHELHAGFLYSRTMGDLLLDWYGPSRIAGLMSVLVERYPDASFTYDDFNRLATELGMPLRENFGDWLRDVRPAGFIASPFTVERLPDQDGLPIYETQVNIRNREAAAGLLSIEYEYQGSGDQIEVVNRTTRPIQVEGNSAIRIALQTNAPVTTMVVNPYFSRNRSPFGLKSTARMQIPSVSREPAAFVSASDWNWALADKILVDDLDVGFTVDEPDSQDEPRFTLRMISFNYTNPELISTDQGLHLFEFGTSHSGEHWTRQRATSAFGTYRRTFARAEHKATARRVHFTSRLPNAGEWQLHYHLPDFVPSEGETFEFRNPYGIDFDGRDTLGRYELTVTQGHTAHALSFDGAKGVAGWNPVSPLHLDSGEVRVSVSTQSSYGTVVADAIYWDQLDASTSAEATTSTNDG